MSNELSAYLEAHSRYQGLRDAAFHAVVDVWRGRVPREVDLRILPPYFIDADALKFWSQLWGVIEKPAAVFPWDEIFDQIWTTPRRLDVAIWDGSLLCGFAAGMASRGNNVTIKFLESWPGDRNKLRGFIAPIAIDVADMYARLLGKQWVMLKDPLPKAIARYHDLGFRLDRTLKGHTYWKRIVE